MAIYKSGVEHVVYRNGVQVLGYKGGVQHFGSPSLEWDIEQGYPDGYLSLSLANPIRDMLAGNVNTRFYVSNDSNGILAYDLSDATDIETATHNAGASLAGYGSLLFFGITFGNSGNKAYASAAIAPSSSYLIEYDTATPYEWAGATEVTRVLLSSNFDNLLRSLSFKDDGLVFIGLDGFGKLVQYDFTTAWDITSMSLTSAASMPTTWTSSSHVASDGLSVITSDYNSDGNHTDSGFNVYELTAAWDASTVDTTPMQTLLVDISDNAFGFLVSGSKLYFCDEDRSGFQQYALPSMGGENATTVDIFVRTAANASVQTPTSFEDDTPSSSAYYRRGTGSASVNLTGGMKRNLIPVGAVVKNYIINIEHESTDTINQGQVAISTQSSLNEFNYPRGFEAKVPVNGPRYQAAFLERTHDGKFKYEGAGAGDPLTGDWTTPAFWNDTDYIFPMASGGASDRGTRAYRMWFTITYTE